jgi:predicted N-acetyltransferase YhbS
MVADIVTVKATNGTAVYVATHEGSVVGTYTLIIDPKVARLGRPAGFLEDVAVAPGWDGRGVGTALVRHALEMARRADCYKVVLTCREGLVDFYARMGFYRSDECYMRVDL